MRRFVESPLVRGLAVIALVSLGIVVLSLEDSLATASALLRIAFFLAVALFLFVLWRERRSDIETWSDLSRNTFYAAAVLAVLDVGVFLGVGANGPESIVFLAVLAACGWAAVRVWRREHHYA